jgi:ABC-2 type transport system ATP-binding protein
MVKVIEFTSENGIIPEDIQAAGLPFTIQRERSGEKGYATLGNFENDLPLLMTYLKSKSISLRHMECRRKTLDDLFVSLTGRKINE